eukprot:scaffold6217_cov125-Isochrysis_galbana.AAC.5
MAAMTPGSPRSCRRADRTVDRLALGREGRLSDKLQKEKGPWDRGVRIRVEARRTGVRGDAGGTGVWH